MTSRQASELENLRLRLIAVTSATGAKTALAKEFKVSNAAVSQWLSGANAPEAETALRLLKWVEVQERKQETPGSATNTARGRKTRKLKSHHYEKSKRVRKKE